MWKTILFIVHIFKAIDAFVHNDHKLEMLIGTTAAGGTGYVMSSTSTIAKELLYRDINTAIMAIVSAVIGFFVTLGLKKLFEKKKKR